MREKKALKIRDIILGEGKPKICAPIVGTTKEEILNEANSLISLPLDLVEWRADWFDSVFQMEEVLDVLKQLRKILGNIALLFTFRTAAEGGEKDIAPETYAALNQAVAASGYVDLVDVEAFFEAGEEYVRNLIEDLHSFGTKVVASNHDFAKTPEKGELIRRMCQMQELGGDIPKIAVMPENAKDVLTLLAATEEMNRCYADRPIITMSMGGKGVISRIGGESFGSALTFGAAKKASAPGQLGTEELNTALEILHRGMNGERL